MHSNVEFLMFLYLICRTVPLLKMNLLGRRGHTLSMQTATSNAWQLPLAEDMTAFQGVSILEEWLAMEDSLDVIASVAQLEKEVQDFNDQLPDTVSINLLKRRLSMVEVDDVAAEVVHSAQEKLNQRIPSQRKRKRRDDARRKQVPRKNYIRQPGDSLTILQKREIASRLGRYN